MNDLMLSGIPLFTNPGSIQIGYGGGAVLESSNSMRTVGQRNPAQAVTVNATVLPKTEDDRTMAQRVLRHAGISPMVLPDGTRLAVQPPDAGQPYSGWPDNETDSNPTTWGVRRDCVLADAFYRGTVGQYGVLTSAYVTTGTNTLDTDVGRTLTGLGSWNQCWLAEGVIANTSANARNHPTLVAEVQADTSVSTEFVVGWTTTPAGAGRPFGTNGVGAYFNVGVLTSVGVNDVIDPNSISLGVTNPSLIVVIIARPIAARVEIWRNTTRLYVNNAVPWTMPATPLRAMFSVRRGTGGIARWWATRG